MTRQIIILPVRGPAARVLENNTTIISSPDVVPTPQMNEKYSGGEGGNGKSSLQPAQNLVTQQQQENATCSKIDVVLMAAAENNNQKETEGEELPLIDSCNGCAGGGDAIPHEAKASPAAELLLPKENNDEQEGLGRILHGDDDLRSIVRNMPESTCNSHRDLLFGLFLLSSAPALESLSGKSGLRLSDAVVKSTGRKKRSREDQTHQNGDSLREEKDGAPLEPANKKKRSYSFLAKREQALPSPISLVPLALSMVVNKPAEGKQKEYGTSTAVVLCSPVNHGDTTNLKRSDHESLTLRELEAKVLHKFESCPLGKQAISTENPQYSWFLIKSEIGKKPAVSALPLVPQAKKKFSAMSLLYNECSMTAFASWASTPAACTEKAAAKRSRKRHGQCAGVEYAVPTSTTLFHCCQICGHWGHQELECERLDQPEILSEIASEVTTLTSFRDQPSRLQRGFQQSESQGGSRGTKPLPTSCILCNLNVRRTHPGSVLVCGECRGRCHIRCAEPSIEAPVNGAWLCTLCNTDESEDGLDSVVEVEGCEGFVIEQRRLPTCSDSNGDDRVRLSKSRGIDFGERSWSRAVCVANTKALSSVSVKPAEPAIAQKAPAQAAAKNKEAEEENKKHAFSKGEFCWAKREHAARGKLGRDEWWPAQVLATITDPRCSKHFSMEVTPYLVKFFGMHRANRVRASSAIPFFQNFRAIGYKRVTTRIQKETEADQRFRRGVAEAVSLMGFKSMPQIVARADEIVHMEKPKSALLQVPPPQRRFIAKKLEAGGFKTFKQDGFIIYARESAKKPGGTSVATKQDELVESPVVAAEVKGPVQVYSRTKLAGCLVAWMSKSERKLNMNMNVGTVLAADVKKKIALVSPILDWEDKLKPPSSTTGVVVHDYHTRCAEWIPMNKLHMLCNGPAKENQQTVSKDVVAALLSSARDVAATEFKKAVADQADIASETDPKDISRRIEAILKERNSYGGREYLIKWKHASGPIEIALSRTTWVPERSITNLNMVLRYHIEKLLSALCITAQMEDKSTTTYRVVEALRTGIATIDSDVEVQVSESKVHLCPFCNLRLDGMHIFADHIKDHQQEPNYNIIREAARLARVSWYDYNEKQE